MLRDSSHQSEPLLADKGLTSRAQTTTFGAPNRDSDSLPSNFGENVVRDPTFHDENLSRPNNCDITGNKGAATNIHSESRSFHAFSEQYQRRLPTTLLLARKSMGTNEQDGRRVKPNTFSCLNLLPCFNMLDDSSNPHAVNLEIPNLKYAPPSLTKLEESSTSTAGEAGLSRSEENGSEKQLNSVDYDSNREEDSDDEVDYKYDLFSSLRGDLDSPVQPVSNPTTTVDVHPELKKDHIASQSDQKYDSPVKEISEEELSHQLKDEIEQENVPSLLESQMYDKLVTSPAKHESDGYQVEDKIAELSFSDELANSDFDVISNPRGEEEVAFEHQAEENQTQHCDLEAASPHNCNKSFELVPKKDLLEIPENLALPTNCNDEFEMLGEKKIQSSTPEKDN